MGRFKIWILVAGVAVGWLGWKEYRLSCEVKKDPQTITCANLAKNGYGRNAHVRVTDFLLATTDFVYKEKRSSKEWSKVWLPVLPIDGEYARMVAALPEDAEEIPSAKSFGVILQSEHVASLDGLSVFDEAPVLLGVVINEVDSLDRKTKKLLAESYPNVDLDECWILEHNRKVSGVGRGAGFLGLGVVLVALAVFLFVRGKKKG